MPARLPDKAIHLSRQVHGVLGPGGRLAGSWSGYENRPGQLLMAEEVARALAEKDVALIEAGTGTGKTLAYLVPALLNGVKTVVSTGTKNLQEQIFQKDIPFIRRSLGSGFRAACLKGRENYLCRYHFQTFLKEPTFPVAQEAAFLDRLKGWAQTTLTGDRAELDDLPDGFMTWADLSASSDRCLGAECPEFKDCYLQQARRVAAAADLIVVNHHLFMADLAVKQGGFGEVIPAYEAVVFDEAHQLEEVATQHFGLEVSTWRLARLRNDAQKILKLQGRLTKALSQALTAWRHQTDVLAKEFITQDGEVELWGDNNGALNGLRDFSRKVLVQLENVAGRLESLQPKEEELETLAGRMRELSREMAFILEAPDSSFVYWAEKRGRGLFLRASPIQVAPYLQSNLYGRRLPLIFTSATLTAKHSFDYFKERLGLMPEIEGLTVDSPFDYARQTLFYVPKSFPWPNQQHYLPALVDEIEKLLAFSRGRAFVLFTSYRNLHYVSEKLAGKLPWPCLIQGQAQKTALLERFRSETHSVLLATQSFWEGVDVPGESLSAVIIDKLPFPRPDQPLVKARSAHLREEGQDPFLTYHLPDAIITLKQGLGRLIRSQTDRGLLAVLDARLLQKNYGRAFLESLPPSLLTHSLEEVESFFQEGE
ncbi:MAG: ATP-dependent DNA helicase [Thermodesulfobacteriota bacterium]